MLKRSHVALLSCCLLLNACMMQMPFMSKNKMTKATKNTTVHDTKITSNNTDEFRPVAPKQIDILHTDLDVSFNWGKHECIGKATLTLKPYFYETDSIVLDAKNMTFNEIALTDNENNSVEYITTYDKKTLRLKLEHKISSQDTLKVMIRYIARPDEIEANDGKSIRDDKGLYFINTDHSEPYKPLQIWTQGEVEASSCWFPTIDKPNEKFTLKLSITVNKDFTTLSNGVLTATSMNGVLKTDVWESNKPMPAYLVMMAIGDFKITKDYLTTNFKDSFVTVTYDTIHIMSTDSIPTLVRDSLIEIKKINYKTSTKDLLNGVEVSYYLEPEYSPYALNIFKNTPEMIDFFAGKLGVDYPWDKYAQVVARDFVAGAMENTSATLHADFVQKNNRELVDGNNDDIISHELFHQWFGDLATCKSWSHLVLNEGFATLGEQLWVEYKYGTDASLLKSSTALNRYLRATRDGNDIPIIQFNYKEPDDMFSIITYQKGALVLNLLRAELGDEAFFLALKNYLNQYAYSNAEIDDLRRECENVSGKDLLYFFNQWFYKGGHPSIELRYDYDDSSKLLAVTVEQKQAKETGLFKFPLSFKVTQANQIKFFNFDIEKRIETFYVKKFDTESVDYPNVFVDPDATFIGEIKDNKPFINYIRTYYSAANYIEKFRSLKELQQLQSTIDTAREVLLMGISDPNADIRANVIEWINWSNPKNQKEAKDILIDMAKSDPETQVRIKATEALANLNETALLNTLHDLTNDSSYTVAAIALGGIYKLLPDEALRLCPQLEKDARRDLFNQIASIYSTKGSKLNASFFENNLLKVFGRTRSSLIEEYADFCTRLNDESIYTQATTLLTDRAFNDKFPFVRTEAVVALNTIYQKQVQENNHEKDLVRKNERLTALKTFHENMQRIIDQERDSDAINMLKEKGLHQTQDVNEDR